MAASAGGGCSTGCCIVCGQRWHQELREGDRAGIFQVRGVEARGQCADQSVPCAQLRGNGEGVPAPAAGGEVEPQAAQLLHRMQLGAVVGVGAMQLPDVGLDCGAVGAGHADA